jgi:predicted RNase H-like HicB family nuclease
MSETSRKSSKAIDRPFSPAILRKARAIAQTYQIVLHQEDGEYYGRSVEMPNIMNDGATPDQCVKATRDILTTAIAYMLETGQAPPPSASEQKRTEQINVRVTAEEKLILEEAARGRGYRGLSDFVRSVSLQRLH